MELDFNNVLKKTATLLNKQEVVLYLEQGENLEYENMQEDIDREIEMMQFCALEAYTEIASDYLPLIYSETVAVTNKQIDLAELTKVYREVVNVYDLNNSEVTFEEKTGYLQLEENGSFVVEYRYTPTMYDVYNDLQDFNGRVSASLMAYGVSSFYCLINNLSEGYNIWETKFKQGLLIARQKINGLKLPARRWI